MSVTDGLSKTATPTRRISGVLLFMPILIIVLATATMVLGQMQGTSANRLSSGYGIDEVFRAGSDGTGRSAEAF